MKNLFLLSLLFVSFLFVSCERVAPNYVGVLMQNYGKNGKSDFTLQKGRVSTMSPGTELFQVPLWEQRAGLEEACNLLSADNTSFQSKFQYTYKCIEKQAIDLVFDNKHLGSGSDFLASLEQNVLETAIYDLTKEASRTYVTDSLMAVGGNLRFEKDLEPKITELFAKKGLELIMFSSNLTFSQKVKDKIDSRNEVNTNISVIDQQIMEQKKTNELEELKAQQAIIRSRGLTPQILQERMIDKWNGVLPIGANPIWVRDLK